MQNNYTPDWATRGPVDFEYRHYSLLAEVKKLKSKLNNEELSETLKKVDDSLDYLYQYDAERLHSSSEKHSNFELTGLNFAEFKLESINKIIEDDEIMDNLLDKAIQLFEDIHSQIREVWQEIESGVNAVYIPSRRPFINDGFIFIITTDNKLHLYFFNKPSKCQTDWRSFKLTHISTVTYTKDVYIQHLDDIKATETEKIIFKVECLNSTKIKGFTLDVIKSKLYTMLKKDYFF